MKKIFIYVSVLAMVLACSDDFTESPAVGALSDKALQNEIGVNLMLTGAYSALDGVRLNSIGEGWAQGPSNWIFDTLSDDAHKGSTDGDQPELYNVETLNWSTGGSYFLGKWSAVWAGAQRANAVIALINTIPEGDFSAQLAEARFLRGHFYFELTKIYKYIPFIDEEMYAAQEFNQPNPSAPWDKIEADFQYAVDNLPTSQNAIGRPTSWVAKAFLGKTHLYQSDWNAALPLLADVVNNGPYSLMTDFVDNFRLAGENSTETMFAIQFTTDDGAGFNTNRQGALNFINGGPYGSCCGFFMPSQDLLNAYKTTAAGLPELDTYADTDVTSDLGIPSADTSFIPYTGSLDPRVDYTIARRGIDYNGYGESPGADWLRNEASDISGAYLPKKNTYWAGETDNMSTGGWGEQNSGVNYHVMRFADVLLMHAEAALETGDLSTALTNVNVVRNRAKTSNYVQAAGGGNAANYVIAPYLSSDFSTQEDARKALRFERRLEMGMEGHRYFDIVRWGDTSTRMNEYVDNESRTNPQFGSEAGTWSSKHNNWPIPITAIDGSGGILTQNPDW